MREIAEVLGCSEDTVERACKREKGMCFAEYFGQKSASGRASLRHLQWRTANSPGTPGCVTMQIFLGKQWLGQADKIEQMDKNWADGLSAEQLLTMAPLAMEIIRRKLDEHK